MKRARRILALLLCLALILGPWMAGNFEWGGVRFAQTEAQAEPAPEVEAAPTNADEASDESEAAESSAAGDAGEAPSPDFAEEAEADAEPSESPDAQGQEDANDPSDARDPLEEPEAQPEDSEAGEGAPSDEPAGEPSDEPVSEPTDAPALRVAETALALGIGEKRGIETSFSDGGSYAIHYASDAPQIASVSEDGLITALAEGAANISLESEHGGAVVSVAVCKKPTRIKFVAGRRRMGAQDGEAKDMLQLRVALEPADAASALRFSSSKKSVVQVDERGVVTALQRGSATITVKTYNGKKASVKLSVAKAPQSVALSGCASALGLGETGTLGVALSSGSGGGCEFSSSDPGVLQVDPETGEFTAVGIGSATLRARTYNGKSAEIETRVEAAPTSLQLSLTEATLGAGEYMPLPEAILEAEGEACAGGVTFTSENTARASITEDGRIKGRKAGDVNIIAESYNHLRATLLLHVAKSPTRLTLSAHHRTLGVGEVLPLEFRFKPGDASSKLQFTSSKPAVASVDEGGAVTALSPGSVKISAKTYNKKGASVKLTVVPRPEQIDLPDELALGLGEKYALKPAILPEGSGGGIRFWVDDEAVAQIDSITGALTAKSLGETAVHVELYNGLSDECRLIVRGAPTGISLQDANFRLSLKDTYQLKPPILAGGDVASGQIRYKSSSKCVKVSPTGLLTAAKTGSARITVSTYNGLKATLKVSVKKAPKSISFAEDSHRLFIDHEFAPELSFSNKAVGSYSLASSNPAVAAITEDGRGVRGISGGTVTLTATAYNGKTDTMEVWVPFLPERVDIDPAEIALGAGDSTVMRAVMAEGCGAELHFESSDPAIASVEQTDNETIRVDTHGTQSAEITLTVRSQNGCVGTAQIHVLEAPTALTVTPSKAGRCIDEKTLQLRVGFGGEGEGGRVEFSSGDESIATVDSDGLVRFVSTGKVNIAAKSYNGHVASCALTIGSKPTGMTFEREECLVALGDTVQLPVQFKGGCESYELSAEDGSVLSTSGNTVTASALGETQVTAVSRSGLRASCVVRVVEAPVGLELDPVEAELTALVGETMQLRATPLSSGAGSVRYSSSDPSVAIVDAATGLVTPLAKGDAVIRAVTYNGIGGACNLHVKLPLEGLKVGIDPGHQAKGDLRKEKMSPDKRKGSKYRCSYSSAGVAHVSEHKINLQVGLKLRDALERLGAEVYMTRETANVNISNKERALMMNRLGVDLVLRIHCNSWTNGSIQGFSAFRRKTCAYKDSEVDPKQGSAKTLLANEKRLGQCVVRHFLKETGAKNRGFGTDDGYTMNNWSKVPCLLVELGFMTHPKEGRKLVKADYQEKMVRGLVNGICEYAGRPLPEG